MGRNQAIEHLPVGRRLAYDPRRGRLWVVCNSCARWNLAPFDERWEALDECEAAFRATALRNSTEHIGLARLREGLELVRVGDAAPREFAGWRYGDEFVRRNTRALGWEWFPVAATGGGAAALLTGGGLLLATAASTLLTMPHFMNLYRTKLRRVTWVDDGDVRHAVRAKHAARSRIVAEPGSDWSLELPYDGGIARVAQPTADSMILPLLASVNQRGSSRRHVNNAVQDLELVGAGPAYLAHVADVYRTTRFGSLPRHASLALEMVSHEADERRALAGEMAWLDRAWREAEEIAAIADGLFG
jgi:hypothetical protein